MDARKTNCPNCGAPIQSEQCAYCGTVFYDFSCIDVSKPCYIKIKHGSQILMAEMYVGDLSVELQHIYNHGRTYNGSIIRTLQADELTVDLHLITTRGFKVIDTEQSNSGI